jgi:TonB family protein
MRDVPLTADTDLDALLAAILGREADAVAPRPAPRSAIERPAAEPSIRRTLVEGAESPAEAARLSLALGVPLTDVAPTAPALTAAPMAATDAPPDRLPPVRATGRTDVAGGRAAVTPSPWTMGVLGALAVGALGVGAFALIARPAERAADPAPPAPAATPADAAAPVGVAAPAAAITPPTPRPDAVPQSARTRTIAPLAAASARSAAPIGPAARSPGDSTPVANAGVVTPNAAIARPDAAVAPPSAPATTPSAPAAPPAAAAATPAAVSAPAAVVPEPATSAAPVVADSQATPVVPPPAMGQAAVAPVAATPAATAPPIRAATPVGVTRPPRIVGRPAATVLRNPGPPGEVTVEVSIDAAGAVEGVRTLSGPMALRATAEAAARQTRFEPALRAGVPVRGVVTVVYTITPR